uniref:Uncharacterized protein n=1 Tax=Anguilla anguilla TaxID=7936 RepID=A0A0E9S106_ANGAN
MLLLFYVMKCISHGTHRHTHT